MAPAADDYESLAQQADRLGLEDDERERFIDSAMTRYGHKKRTAWDDADENDNGGKGGGDFFSGKRQEREQREVRRGGGNGGNNRREASGGNSGPWGY